MKRFWLVILAFCVGCTVTPSDTPHDHEHEDTIYVAQALSQSFSRETTFKQVGVMFMSDSPRLTYVVNGKTNQAEIPFTEERRHVAVIRIPEGARSISLKSSTGFENATIQFFDEIVAPTHSPSAEIVRSTQQALAPANLVVSRADWGARDPDKICGSPHTPSRISIHHTAIPSSDGPDAAATVRQMQAFHIDSNGWCDIGYHFIVAQSGTIYQGRSDETRTGAHVLNTNTDNVGISLIGDYQANVPEQTQIDSTVAILSWVADTYGVPFDRTVIKGHQEWPGQATNCPGQNTLAIFDQIIADAEALADPGDPCPVLGEEGGEVDNSSPCFRQFGPPATWRVVQGEGVGGSLLWTDAWQTNEPSNYARWNLNVATQGNYLVEYNSVAEWAVHNSTRYGIAHNATEENVTIDLSAGTDGWNEIGEFEFAAGEGQWIAVYDDSPIAVEADQHIIADAIRLTLIDETDPVDPVDPNNVDNNGNNDNNDNFNSNTGPDPNNDQDTDPFVVTDADDIRTNDGCCATQGRATSPTLLFLFFALFLFRRKP